MKTTSQSILFLLIAMASAMFSCTEPEVAPKTILVKVTTTKGVFTYDKNGSVSINGNKYTIDVTEGTTAGYWFNSVKKNNQEVATFFSMTHEPDSSIAMFETASGTKWSFMNDDKFKFVAYSYLDGPNQLISQDIVYADNSISINHIDNNPIIINSSNQRAWWTKYPLLAIAMELEGVLPFYYFWTTKNVTSIQDGTGLFGSSNYDYTYDINGLNKIKVGEKEILFEY